MKKGRKSIIGIVVIAISAIGLLGLFENTDHSDRDNSPPNAVSVSRHTNVSEKTASTIYRDQPFVYTPNSSEKPDADTVSSSEIESEAPATSEISAGNKSSASSNTGKKAKPSKTPSTSASESQEPPATTEDSSTTDVPITILRAPETVHRNEVVTITISGKPNTEYRLRIRYKSGWSEANGLGSKVSDSNGNVTWSWKIGGRTSFGTWPIEISGDGKTVTIYCTVSE